MDSSRIYYSTQPILPSNKLSTPASSKAVANTGDPKIPFTQVLAKQLNNVQFSQHALGRLQARNIKLGSVELTKLNNAIDKAAQKGAKESVVFMNNNNLALVVSVKNKTVITAMDGASIKDNIFTNIDSAVMI